MKLARIENNIVVEIAEQPDTFDGRASNPGDFYHPDAGFEIVDSDVEVRMVKDGDSFVAAPPPATPVVPVPASISDRQFFQQLAVAGIITQDQALASNAAVIPAPLLTIIDAMPANQQFATKMLVSGATLFERQNPVTIAIGSAYGMTSDQVDDFFRAAASL